MTFVSAVQSLDRRNKLFVIPYLLSSQDYRNVSPGLLLSGCQLFQLENRHAQGNRRPREIPNKVIFLKNEIRGSQATIGKQVYHIPR